MQVKNEEAYKELKDSQDSLYGLSCIKYAEQWANLMETEISKGKEVKEVAKDLSYQTDVEYMTMAMYTAGVEILIKHWVYGEALRKWYNGMEGN